MSKPFRPCFTYRTNESVSNYRNGWAKSQYITTSFSTYRELRKHIRNILETCIDDVVVVSRSRRGQWGEWFERWELRGGKPVISSQGWM